MKKKDGMFELNGSYCISTLYLKKRWIYFMGSDGIWDTMDSVELLVMFLKELLIKFIELIKIKLLKKLFNNVEKDGLF